ncbi:gas vesicle protein [Nocardioides sp. IC4_145]|uniref:gas vesicle protein GvpJ n=1 Tax=Nocardioides sp. IC4_145 TaxID=2714037 RepID=UPI0014087B44|nr:gas vesicle protein [Nocardioides sp. IC4_145]
MSAAGPAGSLDAVLDGHGGHAGLDQSRADTSDDRPLGGGAPASLVDLLDRLLGTGVVLAGDVVISLAGVDLVQVRLHALITSVRAEMVRGWP